MATAPIIDSRQTDQFAATAGQTFFVLTEAPIDVSDVLMLVNGQAQRWTDDFVVSGSNLTWLNNEFQLETGDKIEISYIF